MTVDQSSRLDRLEALAETTLLAIRELSNRQQTTQQQLDQLSVRQDRTQQQLDQLGVRLDQIGTRLDQVGVNLDRVDAKFNQVAAMQAANAQQIAENTAGIIELRNLAADLIRRQS